MCTVSPAIPLLGVHPKELKIRSQGDICTPMFIAALFTIAERGKQPKWPSTKKWINTMWSIHTAEYYSAMKRQEILTHATTWTQLEDNMLRDITQSQKDKYCMIPLLGSTESSQIHRNVKENGGLPGAGVREKWGVTVK